MNPRRVLNRGQVLNRRRSSRRRWRRRRGRRRRRYPDVKANCFDVKFPKGKSEKRDPGPSTQDPAPLKCFEDADVGPSSIGILEG